MSPCTFLTPAPFHIIHSAGLEPLFLHLHPPVYFAFFFGAARRQMVGVGDRRNVRKKNMYIT
jgi:hypothetical protein